MEEIHELRTNVKIHEFAPNFMNIKRRRHIDVSPFIDSYTIRLPR